ncbi:MAG: acetyltransferase [Candidatus Methanofastidiosum sp.]|nr:acetyltransferase [Methanofastidiosum sp.]
MKSIGILGASGFAREVADICEAMGYDNIILINGNTQSDVYHDYKVLAEKNLEQLRSENYSFIIGIGANHIRRQIAQKYPDLDYVNVIHPSATFGVKQWMRINKSVGNIVAAGVRFTCNIEIGNFNIFNLNSTIGHDCIIGNYVNLSPGVNVSGNVSIGANTFIGTNASILPGKSLYDKLVIGQNVQIGAGAVVVESVRSDAIVMGVPAKERTSI